MSQDESYGLKLIVHRDFGILWLGQITSRVGNNLNWVAIMWMVYETTGSSLKMGLVGICQVGPLILLGPFLGAFVDRAKKKTVMIFADCLCAVCVGVIPILYQFHLLELWHIYLIVTSKAFLAELFSIGINSSLPVVVRKSDLPSANSLLSTTVQFGQFAGPGLAAYLMPRIGVQNVLYIDAITFLISALTVSLVSIPHGSSSMRMNTRLWLEVKDGLSYVLRSNRAILSMVAMVFAVNLCLSPLMVLIPIYSDKVLLAGKEGFGAIFSGWGAGTMLAAFMIAAGKRELLNYRWIARSYVITGVFIIVLGLSRAIEISVLSFTVVGFWIGIGGVLISTYIQRESPPDMLGRIFAIYGMGSHASMPLGLFAVGALSVLYRSDVLIASMGVIILFSGLACALFINHRIEQHKHVQA